MYVIWFTWFSRYYKKINYNYIFILNLKLINKKKNYTYNILPIEKNISNYRYRYLLIYFLVVIIYIVSS